MPPPSLSADGPSGPSAYLDHLDATLTELYDGLGELAEHLDQEAERTEDGADWLGALGWRMTLTEVRSQVLAARHCVHGGMIAILRARPEARLRDASAQATRRPPP